MEDITLGVPLIKLDDNFIFVGEKPDRKTPIEKIILGLERSNNIDLKWCARGTPTITPEWVRMFLFEALSQTFGIDKLVEQFSSASQN